MIAITFTPAQSAAIVAKWNDLANEANQLGADQAYLVVGDGFDEDIEAHGEHMVELRGTKSASGNPVTFTILESDATIEEADGGF